MLQLILKLLFHSVKFSRTINCWVILPVRSCLPASPGITGFSPAGSSYSANNSHPPSSKRCAAQHMQKSLHKISLETFEVHYANRKISSLKCQCIFPLYYTGTHVGPVISLYSCCAWIHKEPFLQWISTIPKNYAWNVKSLFFKACV